MSSSFSDRGFGRLPSEDPRDLGFLLRRSLAATAPVPYDYRFWHVGEAFDQGSTPRCVAYSGGHWLKASPVKNRIPKPEDEFLKALYDECQANDEWPGNSYDGTSVRALFKVLQRRGLVSRYEWSWDVRDIAQWVLRMGPMVVGTEWTVDMMGDTREAARTDFISATGYAVGGHAYLIKGVNLLKRCPDGSKGAFRLLNSWGREWCFDGMAWLSFHDLQILLNRGGEACTATEVKAAS